MILWIKDSPIYSGISWYLGLNPPKWKPKVNLIRLMIASRIVNSSSTSVKSLHRYLQREIKLIRFKNGNCYADLLKSWKGIYLFNILQTVPAEHTVPTLWRAWLESDLENPFQLYSPFSLFVPAKLCQARPCSLEIILTGPGAWRSVDNVQSGSAADETLLSRITPAPAWGHCLGGADENLGAVDKPGLSVRTRT